MLSPRFAGTLPQARPARMSRHAIEAKKMIDASIIATLFPKSVMACDR
jgi:hypothetical protein